MTAHSSPIAVTTPLATPLLGSCVCCDRRHCFAAEGGPHRAHCSYVKQGLSLQSHFQLSPSLLPAGTALHLPFARHDR